MKLNKNDLVKILILQQYKKKNSSYTASLLAHLLKFKPETIKKGLEFLSYIGILEKEIKEHGKRNYSYFNLTDMGTILINQEQFDDNLY